MPKPSMPTIPGMGVMTDTLDFVKNLWGGMNIPGMNLPGMVMPTLSVEDINKQISDLKAVESWLTLNMNMLRGTIQALEVQSATLSTLQSMGETLSAAVRSNAATSTAAAEKTAAPKESMHPFSKPVETPTVDAKPKSEPIRPLEAGNGEAINSMAPLANPAVWWNMLQDQFKQAVNTAMASEKSGVETSPKAASNTETKKPSTSRTRKTSKPT